MVTEIVHRVTRAVIYRSTPPVADARAAVAAAVADGVSLAFADLQHRDLAYPGR